jgi:hypothetical protein
MALVTNLFSRQLLRRGCVHPSWHGARLDVCGAVQIGLDRSASTRDPAARRRSKQIAESTLNRHSILGSKPSLGLAQSSRRWPKARALRASVGMSVTMPFGFGTPILKNRTSILFFELSLRKSPARLRKQCAASTLRPGQLSRTDGTNQEAVGKGSFVVKVTCGRPAIGGRPRSAAGGRTEPPTPPTVPPRESISAPRPLALRLRQAEEIAHRPFDDVQRINTVESNILAHPLFHLAPQRINALGVLRVTFLRASPPQVSPLGCRFVSSAPSKNPTALGLALGASASQRAQSPLLQFSIGG